MHGEFGPCLYIDHLIVRLSKHFVLSEILQCHTSCQAQDGNRFIWSSERNGFNNYYLYDLSGKLLKTLTDDKLDAGRILRVDEDANRFFYMASVLHCLPVGMVGEGAAGTGTVMRPTTVEAYARCAGFQTVEVAPVEHDSWRFYLIRP